MSGLSGDLDRHSQRIEAKIDSHQFKISQLQKTLMVLKTLSAIQNGTFNPEAISGAPSKPARTPRASSPASGAERAPRGQAFEEIRAAIESAGPKTGMTRKAILDKLNVSAGQGGNPQLYSRYANALAGAEKKGTLVKNSSGVYTLADT